MAGWFPRQKHSPRECRALAARPCHASEDLNTDDPTKFSGRLPSLFTAAGQRFGNMYRQDMLGFIEVRERARHAQNAVIAARGEVECVGRVAQKLSASRIRSCDLVE